MLSCPAQRKEQRPDLHRRRPEEPVCAGGEVDRGEHPREGRLDARFAADDRRDHDADARQNHAEREAELVVPDGLHSRLLPLPVHTTVNAAKWQVLSSDSTCHNASEEGILHAR